MLSYCPSFCLGKEANSIVDLPTSSPPTLPSPPSSTLNPRRPPLPRLSGANLQVSSSIMTLGDRY